MIANASDGGRYKFAFLVHPRSKKDVFIKFPFLKYMPKWFLVLIERYLPPVLVSKVSGLSDESGNKIDGYIIAIPMLPARMLKERDRAVWQIRKAIQFAQSKGVKMIGLGALTSSLTHGGAKLIDIKDVSITTGHAYTGYNVTRYILELSQKYELDLNSLTIGIVGAAGSIGGISTKILNRAGVKELILIDLDRKISLVNDLAKELEGTVTVTTDLKRLKSAHFIVAATNTPEALIKSEHILPGTIIVDDAQPSDVEDALFTDQNVVVLEAGAVKTPGIKSNFNIGLYGEDVNYCCMAELLLLSSVYHEGHYLIGAPSLKYVDDIQKIGARLGFTLPPYQNMHGLVSNDRIERVIDLLKKRL